ncbi:cysteine hydrolase family protein [Bacillus sp. C1]
MAFSKRFFTFHYSRVIREERGVANTEYLLQEARRKGVTVVHIPLSFTPDYREISEDATALASIIKENKRFQQNTYGAEIYPVFAPTSSDLVAEGRKEISGFAGSNLDHLLRARGIRHVAVAGFVTEVCVELTIRDAYDRGYHCTLFSNCTAAHSNEDQTYVEKTIMPYFGNVLTAKELIDQLG